MTHTPARTTTERANAGRTTAGRAAAGRVVARRVGAGVLAVGTVLAVSAPPASAHTALTGADPKKDSSIASPSQIVLTYSETIRLPRVLLTDASGKQHQAGTARAVDNKVTQPVSGALPNGKYTVGWRVVSADGHPVSGSYKFTVEGSSGTAGSPGPAGSPSPEGSQPAAPAASPSNVASSEDSDGGSSGWLWIGLIALVVAGAAGAVAWFRRSSAPGS
ncbi:copper resistance protein CopC [Actinomadura sp. 9N215]|uniref:copper resistance protein CopC n=1 Tax=Actinomadura sp. 9N215 TaxID=3375150 RepID=UPI00379DF993